MKSAMVKAANQRISKLMNVVRFIAEHEYFGGRHVGIIEEAVKPLLLYMKEPQLIDFDDDLVFCVDALIKKSQSCSQTMMDFYSLLPNF